MLQRLRAASGRPAAVRAAALAVGAALVVPGATATASTSGDARVVLRDVGFHARVVRIKAGHRVTWSWEDPYVTHNLHAVGTPRFPGASARQKGTYRATFRKRGTYRYECTLHPGMTGTVVVR